MNHSDRICHYSGQKRWKGHLFSWIAILGVAVWLVARYVV